MKAVGFWQPGKVHPLLKICRFPIHAQGRDLLIRVRAVAVNPRDRKAGETSVPLQAIR
jgi:NADPH:quinone reductase-like Zn-dependent oxidoreductase